MSWAQPQWHDRKSCLRLQNLCWRDNYRPDYQNPGILRTEGCRFVQVGCGLRPFALPALNRSNCQVNVRGVWQTSFRNLKFIECALIISFAVVVIETKRKMCFRQVGLQTNRRLGRGTRFFLSRGSRGVGGVQPVEEPWPVSQ